MLAAVFHGQGDARVAPRPVPEPAEGEITVDVDACGVCGSDLHVMGGSVVVPTPLVLGHELSGRVRESRVDGLVPGTPVTVLPLLPCGTCAACRDGRTNHCVDRIDLGLTVDGGFAEVIRVPRARVGETVFVLPAAVSAVAAAVVEPLAVGLRAASLAGAERGDRALVLGCGMIGQAVIAFLRQSGVGTVVAVDVSPERRAQALARGADDACGPDELRELLGGEPVAAAIDCAGHPDTVAAAVRHTGHGGTVVLAGVYGRRVPVTLDAVVGRELRVQGSFAYASEFGHVIEMLARGDIDGEAFVSRHVSLTEAPSILDRSGSSLDDVKVLVRPAR
ncbi:Threonine dehydrogenase [Patulibacter medicamentivorans]|uniref:Threonine dehydrogenase n=1 Tax=Patulibacter medicamentivorans TaxID=1097667 RepID=H0E673_9ACTN|nr:alcohol dehydrogenase catalytic domain-containing protein [Patulibacter medicamentivorans]EHN10842.1 Threonine dehydrogenase [Patulibacter medicamentivorans]